MGRILHIDLSEVQREGSAFWSLGNRPTQLLYGLSTSVVLDHLKSLYLLCDKVLAAGSFYFESEITRKVTEKLELLFERGDILYFIDASLENFAEHGAKKVEKSPAGLICYHDSDTVQDRAKRLDSIGHLLRRPSYSLSDRIVELWIRDVYSRAPGTVGEYVSLFTREEKARLTLESQLIHIAETRRKDFVWEYISPRLRQLQLPKEFQRLARIRLSHMYSVATAELLGVPLDRLTKLLPTSYITIHSRFDTTLFLICMEILKIREYIRELCPIDLVELKTSPEFIFFKSFYFSLIEAISYQPGELRTSLPIYRDAALRFMHSGVTIDDFLMNFKSLCKVIGKLGGRYSRPLDILLRVYSFFDRLPIEDFIKKLKWLAKGEKAKEGRTKADYVEDKTIGEAQRLLKFICSLKEDPGEQIAETHNDPQIMRIIGFIESALHGNREPLKILDYGCGKGPLITELVKVKQFMDGSHQYIGVNYESVENAKKHAGECNLYNRNIPPIFYTTEEFENLEEPPRTDLIFIRNVTHEIPLQELGRRFYYLLRSLKKGGKIFLLDMSVLHKGEAKKVTWEDDDFVLFLGDKHLDVISNTYQSRGGIPLIAVTIKKKADNIPSEKELFVRAVRLFEEKKKRTEKALDLYESGKARMTEFQVLHLVYQFRCIQRYLDEAHFKNEWLDKTIREED